MFRIYVERKAGFQNEAARIYAEISGFLGISSVTAVRYVNRYDIENVAEEVAREAALRIFSEPQSDSVTEENFPIAPSDTVIVWEYLPGQYDQRADSAEQCLSLLRESMKGSTTVGTEPPRVRCAKMVILSGQPSASDIQKIEQYLINPVDSRLTDGAKPQTLAMQTTEPADIPVIEGFISMKAERLEAYRKELGLAMDFADIKWMQDYFTSIKRDPTLTEIRVLDTYWSDHCRHTTFNTVLSELSIEEGPYSEDIEKSLARYRTLRTELYAERKDKPVTLMDMAVIGAKYLRSHGKLDDLEESAEINACSVYIDVNYSTDSEGKPLDTPETERWLLQFKNETHNHPTEIEPFGGAATCIGGAIRDPLSGRSWVYQAMRITGAADPTVPLADTLPGKLPQKKLCIEAAQGFSSYGNQIGLTTGQVVEVYHPGFLAKRMELGAVIAAAPADQVKREEPETGDIVILLGGGTGRDGIGGATGSSKVHDVKSVSTAAAEVQKGNAVEERKIQRLFRNKAVCQMIRRCNDFGAGGVSVAVGELAAGLDIDLDAVPKKYEGLDGTELAISESQERMAVVVRSEDAERFIAAARAENLNAVVVATVTDTARMVMHWRGKTIVDIERSFIDTAGAPHKAAALISSPAPQEASPLCRPLDGVVKALGTSPTAESLRKAWLSNMGDLACCSQRGLMERFDSTIGASSVLYPYGGSYQSTPEAGMAAKIPVQSPRETTTASLMAYGYDPRVSEWSPFHGAQFAVLDSLTKIACLGGNPESCRLTFQEFFGRCVDDRTWGYPAAALLGALSAQLAMGTGSIGGKDSMSGTFEQLNVPHTLVSFAVDVTDAGKVKSGAFKAAGNDIYLVQTPWSDTLLPDFAAFKKNAAALKKLSESNAIAALYPVGAGGIAEALSKMALGNRIGAVIGSLPAGGVKGLFTPRYGSILVEADASAAEAFKSAGFVPGTLTRLGNTADSEEAVVITSKASGLADVSLTFSELQDVWESRLASVFPASTATAQKELPSFAAGTYTKTAARTRAQLTTGAKPKVLIPVFPGTNCEYDMARAFTLNGADTQIFVFRNRTPAELAESLDSLRQLITGAQILAFAGGFSAGDEPDGSGKFIANVIRERRIADAIMALLTERDGLVLGICNGFQALIKTGLVPYGEIRGPSAEMPTLTFNTIGHHVSRMVRTELASTMSPWAAGLDAGKDYLVPVSHGEGRVIASDTLAVELFAKGQVFTRYSKGDNPNGSSFDIEGLTSPDGRVLGKMGHNERVISLKDGELLQNTAPHAQNIFRAGVAYFAG